MEDVSQSVHEMRCSFSSSSPISRARAAVASAGSDADKEAAYQTLYVVLVTFAKLLAPVLPYMTEVMYQNLVRSVDDSAPESVHHCYWPKVDEAAIDQAAEEVTAWYNNPDAFNLVGLLLVAGKA